jgi:phosphate starvation-inducible protein PhoH
MLTLAGVNDGNLVELSRLCGVKVALRGDTLTVSGPPALVDRAGDIGRRMIERARQRLELTADDVLRLSEDDGADGTGEGRASGS